MSNGASGRKNMPSQEMDRLATQAMQCWADFQEGRMLSAAADVDERSGGVGGFVGKQPEDGASDFVDCAATPHRDGRFDALDAVGFAAAGMDLGVDDSGTNTINTNALEGDFLGEANGESIKRRL